MPLIRGFFGWRNGSSNPLYKRQKPESKPTNWSGADHSDSGSKFAFYRFSCLPDHVAATSGELDPIGGPINQSMMNAHDWDQFGRSGLHARGQKSSRISRFGETITHNLTILALTLLFMNGFGRSGAQNSRVDECNAGMPLAEVLRWLEPFWCM